MIYFGGLGSDIISSADKFYWHFPLWSSVFMESARIFGEEISIKIQRKYNQNEILFERQHERLVRRVKYLC